jgi:hypothetical protein
MRRETLELSHSRRTNASNTAIVDILGEVATDRFGGFLAAVISLFASCIFASVATWEC